MTKGKHDWSKMVEAIQMHIKSLNFGYKKELNLRQVAYKNKFARLLDAHTIELTDNKGAK